MDGSKSSSSTTRRTVRPSLSLPFSHPNPAFVSSCFLVSPMLSNPSMSIESFNTTSIYASLKWSLFAGLPPRGIKITLRTLSPAAVTFPTQSFITTVLDLPPFVCQPSTSNPSLLDCGYIFSTFMGDAVHSVSFEPYVLTAPPTEKIFASPAVLFNSPTMPNFWVPLQGSCRRPVFYVSLFVVSHSFCTNSQASHC